MTAQLDEHYEKGFIASDTELDPKPQIRIVNIKKMIEDDKLTSADVFKRTYLGHARMSSARHARVAEVGAFENVRRRQLIVFDHLLDVNDADLRFGIEFCIGGDEPFFVMFVELGGHGDLRDYAKKRNFSGDRNGRGG